jgi:hypothetical protein
LELHRAVGLRFAAVELQKFRLQKFYIFSF